MTTPNGRRFTVLAGSVAATLLAASIAMVAQAAAPMPPAAPPAPPPAAAPVPQNGPTIKDTYKGHFLIGTAADLPGNFTPEELDLIKANFNVITPENCMKPGPVHPQEDQWNFGPPDALVKFGTENNIAIIGHNLCWYQQTNAWFFAGGDKDTVTARLKNHIMTLVGRYKGKIKGWDVVNEAINDGGSAETGKTENLRSAQWLQILGPDYLTMAFKFAHEADPAAELHYNDYNIEKGPKHDSSMLLLKRLIKDGAPITAVGIQGHWGLNNLPYADIEKSITDYGSLGLKVMITELDITITGQGGGQFGAGGAPGAGGGRRGGRGAPGAPGTPGAPGGAPPAPPATPPAAPAAPGAMGPDELAQFFVAAPAGPAAPGGAPAGPGAGRAGGRGAGGGGFGGGGGRGGGAPPSAEQLQAQADAYAKLFAIFDKHKDVVTRVTFWGLNDRRSWRAGQNPLIFDAQNLRKSAYNSIVDVILKPDATLGAPK